MNQQRSDSSPILHPSTSGHGTMTMPEPGGGGGRAAGAASPAGALPRCVEVVLTDADTHLKNAFNWSGCRLLSSTTLSVIRLSFVESAPGPAAQAMMFHFRPFTRSAADSQLSVGWPSVMMKMSGFQSPFCVGVALRTSLSTDFSSRLSASPMLVGPDAVNVGSVNVINSVRGQICWALLLNVMTER